MKIKAQISCAVTAKADQRLCFLYMDSTLPPLLKLLACLCNCTCRFVSNLVGNPEDMFSRVAAQTVHDKIDVINQRETIQIYFGGQSLKRCLLQPTRQSELPRPIKDQIGQVPTAHEKAPLQCSHVCQWTNKCNLSARIRINRCTDSLAFGNIRLAMKDIWYRWQPISHLRSYLKVL